MRRFLLLFIILFLSFTLFAQTQRGVKGSVDISGFPNISFVWNSPNPAVMDSTKFRLTDEEGKDIHFRFDVVTPKGDMKFEKSVLFLWEDMKSHSNQSENTRKLLVDFFKKTDFDQLSKFNVAVFNRKSDLKNSVLEPLLPDFSSKTNKLADSVAHYKRSTRVYNEYPKETDLYSAIEEGVKMLKNEPSGRVKIIVVVTAGLSMKASGASTEKSEVVGDALRAGIPIYVVKYHQIAGDVSEVNSLATRTYGQILKLTDGRVDETVAGLQDLYKKLDANSYGQDYKFTFTTEVKRDGNRHPFNLYVNDEPRPVTLQFPTPSMTFGLWVKEHIVLCILLILLFVGLIVLATWFFMRIVKNQKIREVENKAQLLQEIEKVNQERSNWMNIQQRREEAKLVEEAQKAREEEEKRLLQLMHTKNMYPRLQCDVNDTTFTYTIHQIVTSIGRNQGNDVVLPSNTVSGVHAEIRFDGTSFQVFNRSQSYGQGIIVNGQFFQQCMLKNGDMIGLGESVIMFYV